MEERQKELILDLYVGWYSCLKEFGATIDEYEEMVERIKKVFKIDIEVLRKERGL